MKNKNVSHQELVSLFCYISNSTSSYPSKPSAHRLFISFSRQLKGKFVYFALDMYHVMTTQNDKKIKLEWLIKVFKEENLLCLRSKQVPTWRRRRKKDRWKTKIIKAEIIITACRAIEKWSRVDEECAKNTHSDGETRPIERNCNIVELSCCDAWMDLTKCFDYFAKLSIDSWKSVAEQFRF